MSLESTAVAAYLASHPDFFEEHSELLGAIKLTSGFSGRAISLQERQMEVLREKHKALELKLVDALETSDDYLHRAAESADLYRVHYKARPTLQQRVLSAVRAGADDAAAWLSQRDQDGRFP